MAAGPSLLARSTSAGATGVGMAGVAGAALLFATSGTTRALLVPQAAPTSVAAVRLTVGAAAMVLFVIWRGRGGQLRALLREPLTWIMGVAVASYQALFFVGVSSAGVAVGTLVSLGCAPLVAGLLGYLLGEGPPGWPWLAATLLAAAGLGLLVSTEFTGAGPGSVLGILAALGAGASYATYTALGTRLARRGWDPAVALAAPFAIGSLFVVGFAPAAAGWLFTPAGLAAAAWLGLVATAGAYLLFSMGLPVLAPGTIATLTLLEPVGATILGMALLHEALPMRGWVGCGLILVGLAVLSLATGRTRGEAPGLPASG